MHRQQLLDLLADYHTNHPQENHTCEAMISFVQAQAHCFERSLSEGHITGSCWLVDKMGTRVLLTHHKKLNRWLQLGGHADGDSDVLRVALKEAAEESGIAALEACSDSLFDIDIHPIPARGPEPLHFHYDCRFAIRSTHSDDFIVSDESHDLAWIEVAQLGTRTTEESMLRMAHKWMQQY